ncbi:MAG TPA: DsrE family protein [Nitrospiraceae bacterium]|jgi:intracellular sulfur oxidation DsrE/DsrF family protein
MVKHLAVVAALVVALLPSQQVRGAGAGEVGGADRSHYVVMHLNSGDEKVQRGVVNNIRNLYQELGPERLHLELVVHGAGLSLLTKNTTTLGHELTRLKAEFGVNYTACSNTMKAMKVGRDDLISEVGDTVPAMVRLMERQEQGWVYIKP